MYKKALATLALAWLSVLAGIFCITEITFFRTVDPYACAFRLQGETEEVILLLQSEIEEANAALLVGAEAEIETEAGITTADVWLQAETEAREAGRLPETEAEEGTEGADESWLSAEIAEGSPQFAENLLQSESDSGGNILPTMGTAYVVSSDQSEEREADASTEDAVPVWQQEGLVCALDEEAYDLLLRIVEAEAGGEDAEGKLLVADVVLNRVISTIFPDTITEVILQESDGVAQFSPVSTGTIWTVVVSEETKEAVYRALTGEDISQGALYFAARQYADSERMRWFDENLTFLFQHGGHEFFY